MADALLDPRRATHRAGAPAAHVAVRPFIDRRRAHVERVNVDRRVLHPSVRDRRLDHLRVGRHRGAGFRDLETVERAAGPAGRRRRADRDPRQKDAGLHADARRARGRADLERLAGVEDRAGCARGRGAGHGGGGAGGGVPRGAEGEPGCDVRGGKGAGEAGPGQTKEKAPQNLGCVSNSGYGQNRAHKALIPNGAHPRRSLESGPYPEFETQPKWRHGLKIAHKNIDRRPVACLSCGTVLAPVLAVPHPKGPACAAFS